MSILPLLLELAEDLTDYYPRRSFIDDDFGFGIYPQEISRIQRQPKLYLTYPRHRSTPYSMKRKQQQNFRNERNDAVTINNEDGFQLKMEVKQFKPNEISVKTVDDFVVVEGKHEEREDDHGFISRHFIRRYKLPEGYDPNQVASTLSSDGMLTIKAPPPPKTDNALKGTERPVQIQQTGPVRPAVEDGTETEENGVPNGSQN